VLSQPRTCPVSLCKEKDLEVYRNPWKYFYSKRRNPRQWSLPRINRCMLELGSSLDSTTRTTAVSTARSEDSSIKTSHKRVKSIEELSLNNRSGENRDLYASHRTSRHESPPSPTMRGSNSNNSHGLSILPRINIGAQDFARRNETVDKSVGRRRFNWKILVAGGTLLFLFVWLLGPRERREKVLGAVGNAYPYGKGTWLVSFHYSLTNRHIRRQQTQPLTH